MKKISLFMLMIFGLFILFAQEAPKEEPKNEVKEEAQPAEAAPEAVKEEAQPEAVQPAETAPEAQVKEEPKEEAQPEAVQQPENAGSVQEEQAKEPQPDTAAELEQQAEESHAAVVQDEIPVVGRQPKTDYYRPYLGVGVPFVVLGSLSVVILMPAMGAMAFAASDGCKDKDWDFCEQCRNDHHTAWTTGAVLSGVIGAGMIVTGSWLITVQKPRENQYVKLNNVAVVPTKKGMMASVGFNF